MPLASTRSIDHWIGEMNGGEAVTETVSPVTGSDPSLKSVTDSRKRRAFWYVTKPTLAAAFSSIRIMAFPLLITRYQQGPSFHKRKREIHH
jgi:hypothetical protein